MTDSETTNPSRANIALADSSLMVLFGNSFQPCAPERLPVEFQGFLRIAGRDVRKVGNVTRLADFAPSHERER